MWTEILLSLSGGVLGALTTLISVFNRKRQSRKGDWWDKFTWAAEAQASDDAKVRAAAREVLKGLMEDKSVSPADRKAAEALLHDQVEIHLTSNTTRDIQIKV